MIKVPDSWASYPTNSIELSLDMDEAPSETPKVNSTPQSTELSKVLHRKGSHFLVQLFR